VKMIILNSDNVEAAMDILVMNFGRPEDIIHNLIQDSKNIPAVQRWDDFVQFSNGVLNLVATIQNLDENVYMSNPLLLREFVEKLPPFIGLNWAEYLMTYHIRNPDLNHFGGWVKESSKIVAHAGLMNRSRTESNLSTINDDGKTIDDTKSFTKQAV
jgi:hypothetical protein